MLTAVVAVLAVIGALTVLGGLLLGGLALNDHCRERGEHR